MKTRLNKVWPMVTISIAVSPFWGQVPPGAAPKPAALSVGTESYYRYPSLEPAAAISVQLADPAPVYDLMKKAIGSDPHNPLWDCTRPSSYKVAVVSRQSDGSLKDVRILKITSVALQGNDDTGKRLRYCDVGSPGQVQLIFNPDLGSKETLQVTLVGLPEGSAAKSDGTLQYNDTVLSFSATPQAAPSDKLRNGKTRDTGQAKVLFSDSNLLSSVQLPFNVYAKSSDLFSTDEKDSQSSFSAAVGLQRGIFPRWFAPIHFDETVQGNQTATNLSNVASLGITTLLPWSWSARLLYNSIIQAPLPPDLTIGNQYTHRINQLVAAGSKLLAIDDYSLNPVANWSSVRFPWACTVFGWMHITQKGTQPNPSKPGDKGTQPPQYCLGTELNFGGYYLPLDLTEAQHQRVEGYGDVSILIPLSGLSFASKVFPYLSSNDPAKSQIRIKWSDSVNAANNYARDRHWTYGIELIK